MQVGPFAIRWYGLMYSLTFFMAWPLLKYRARRWFPELTSDRLGDLIVWIMVGIVLGGRLGYALFYQGGYYIDHPLAILKVWEGGMSFHGGLLGGLLAGILFARRHGYPPLKLADLVFPIAPLGLFLGRIGNFINGELWGKPTDLAWGMVFPGAGHYPRHPSQLYEAFAEGIVLFALLWWIGRKPRPHGFLLSIFLIGYAVARFMVEFVREPDAHLGYLSMGLSMGQWLSLPMLAAGILLMHFTMKNEDKTSSTKTSSGSRTPLIAANGSVQ